MVTTVSRRLVYVKMKTTMKKTKNPHAPLPKRSSSDEMVGEQAKPLELLAAAVPRPQVEESGWPKFAKPVAISIFLGVATLGGAAAMMANSQRHPPYDDAVAASSPVRQISAPSHAARTSAYPSAPEPATASLSQREAPTDESFLAAAYVRRKPSAANISGMKISRANPPGECTVKNGDGRDMADCLRRLVRQ